MMAPLTWEPRLYAEAKLLVAGLGTIETTGKHKHTAWGAKKRSGIPLEQ